MLANVPREIVLDVLGFLPRLDLNNDLVVNSELHDIIKGASEKQLPQRQEVTMRTVDQPNEPFAVELSITDKTVKCTEGQDNPKDVLKNCIVDYEGGVYGVDDFQELFRRIQALVGTQPIPLKLLNFELGARFRNAQVQDLTRFREVYASIFSFSYPIIF